MCLQSECQTSSSLEQGSHVIVVVIYIIMANVVSYDLSCVVWSPPSKEGNSLFR